MSSAQEHRLKCPQCGAEQDVLVYSSINVTIDPSLRDRLLAAELNLLTCHACGNNALIDTSLLYHDMEKQFCVGQSCSSGSECRSTFCVGGVCCDRACNGPTESCTMPGHAGICTVRAAAPVASARGVVALGAVLTALALLMLTRESRRR